MMFTVRDRLKAWLRDTFLWSILKATRTPLNLGWSILDYLLFWVTNNLKENKEGRPVIFAHIDEEEFPDVYDRRYFYLTLFAFIEAEYHLLLYKGHRISFEQYACFRDYQRQTYHLKGTKVVHTLPAITEDKLVVSIAAGVTLGELHELLVPGTRTVRVMPNTPCQVGSGASAFALGPSAREEDGDLVNLILAGVGISFGPVPESWLDAVTGLSGSGPAFAAVVIEALADGGVLCGLPRDMAITLAAQTMLGAARLILETGIHPAQLKDMVASPGGTTIEGVLVLEEHGLRCALIGAVEAATLKSRALGQK